MKELLLDILPRDSQFHDFEITHTFEDVGEKTMLLNARRIILEKYKTELILLAVEDITKRKATEQMKDDFIGVATHELRTPLGSIKSLAQALQIDAKNEDHSENIASLNILEQQIDRLSDIISSFTDLYRAQSGKLELRKSDIDMNAMIEDVAKMFRTVNKTHAIEIVGKISAVAYADRTRIEQVLINLISNAIKYSPKADKVIISVSEPPGMIKVSVQDFGIGIPKEQLGNVRERFFRIRDQANPFVEGLGLGLHISNEIIKEHGGEMLIESTAGQGSIFSFTLPVSDMRADDRQKLTDSSVKGS